MEQNSHPRDIKRINEQIKASFSSVYLTLISIIQSCVLGYLMFLIGTHWTSLSLITTPTILIVSTFLIIIT